MNFNFGEILTRSWQITWKHKVLWIFGVLASCSRLGNGGGRVETGYRTDGSEANLPPQVLRLFQLIEENAVTVLVILCVFILLVWLITIAIGAIGKTGLIRGALQADGSSEKLIFGQLFSESMPYFWRMSGLAIILNIPLIIFVIGFVAIFFGVAISIAAGSGDAALSLFAIFPAFIGCICLLIPIMFVLGMIFHQAERAVVLEDMRALPSISRGWEIFKRSLGPILLMAIILGIISLVTGLVIAIPLFIAFFPAMLAYFAGGGESTAPLIVLAVCTCLYVPIALLLQGIMIAFTESAWTLTYLRLTRNTGSSDQPILDNQPLEPDDLNKTVISTRSNA